VWAGNATVVVEVDAGGDVNPRVARFGWSPEAPLPLIVWGDWGRRLLVLAVALSGDSGTPREDLELGLIVLADWPGDG
jgi:hypothetical protein